MISVVVRAFLLWTFFSRAVVTVSFDNEDLITPTSLFGSSAFDVHALQPNDDKTSHTDAMISDLHKAFQRKSTDLIHEKPPRKLQATMDFVDFTKLLDPNYVDDFLPCLVLCLCKEEPISTEMFLTGSHFSLIP
jgi:hypothetical protein